MMKNLTIKLTTEANRQSLKNRVPKLKQDEM